MVSFRIPLLMVSQKKRRNYRAQADKFFSQYIRARDGRCLAQASTNCTETVYLQCAHLISRSYQATRVNPSNAVALCVSCHKLFSHRPIEWELWVRETFGDERWDSLVRQALTHERPDWKYEAAYWRSAVAELG